MAIALDNATLSAETIGLSDLAFGGEPSIGGISSALSVIGGVLAGAVAGSSSPPAASSGPFSTIYAFGDSLTDAGNVSLATFGLVPVSPPYQDGHFTNGPVWVQDMAQDLGMAAPQPSLGGGTDFAYGGAQTGPTAVHTANPTDFPGQIAQFAIQDPHPLPNSLYTVWIGSNDVLSIEGQAGQTASNAYAEIQNAVQNEVAGIAVLASRGAKDFMVANVPDLGKTPYVMAGGAAASSAASVMAQWYDGLLAQSLQPLVKSGTINLDLIDTYGLLDGVISNAGAFGFNNVRDPLWTGNLTSSSSGTLQASTPAGQAGYLFFDSLHPTAQGHALLGQYAASTVAHAFA